MREREKRDKTEKVIDKPNELCFVYKIVFEIPSISCFPKETTDFKEFFKIRVSFCKAKLNGFSGLL